MAVPVLTIAQLIGNLSRAFFGFKEIQWKPVIMFIAGALPMSVLGAISFVKVPKELITRGIGLAIVTFVALKYFNLLKFQPKDRTMLVGGAIVGFISGLVGSAGPIGAALFLSLNLPPVSYIASEAVTAVAMHIAKTVILSEISQYRFIRSWYRAFYGRCHDRRHMGRKESDRKNAQREICRICRSFLSSRRTPNANFWLKSRNQDRIINNSSRCIMCTCV